jgi:hypothetical protein
MLLFALHWKSTASWQPSAFHDPVGIDSKQKDYIITYDSEKAAQEVIDNLPHKIAIQIEIVKFIKVEAAK